MLAKQQNSVGIIKTVDFKLPAVPKNCVITYNNDLTLKKISQYSTEEDLFLMNALITRWSVYIGIKKILPEEINLLANFIRENYGELNDYDVNRALNMLMKEELEVDAEAYGSISPLYISKVLNAYLQTKRDSIRRVKDELEKIERSKPKEIDKNQRLESFKKLLLNAKEDSNMMEYIDFGNVLYNFIKKNNLATEITESDIESAENYARNRVYESKKASIMKAVIQDKAFAKSDSKEQELIRNKRQYLINVWLKKTNIENIINNITYEMLID